MSKHNMNYAFDGENLSLISKSTKISSEVPPGTYTFGFSQHTGLFITTCNDVPDVTNKVYGDTIRRVDKAWRAFKRRERNTGVLLSGEAGMGKSMFIKLLCAKAKEEGFPVFIVKADLPGITSMLSRITSECVVVLDEFEKNFREMQAHEDNDVHSQDGFLSLMDGMDDGKKLFIAAVNETYNISKYMLNRPGRFLYHYKFNYCEQEQIVEYLEDTLTNKELVDEVATALIGHHINFDALAAICGELNAGEPLEDTLQDLNLDDADSTEYDLSIEIDGNLYRASSICISMRNAANGFNLWNVNDPNRDDRVQVKFASANLKKASNSKYETGLVVSGNKLIIDDCRRRDSEGRWEKWTPETNSNLRLTKHYDFGGSGFHYVGRKGEVDNEQLAEYFNAC